MLYRHSRPYDSDQTLFTAEQQRSNQTSTCCTPRWYVCSPWHSGTQAMLALHSPKLIGALTFDNSKMTSSRMRTAHTSTWRHVTNVVTHPPWTDAVLTHLNPRRHPLASRSHCDPLPSLLCCCSSLIRLCSNDDPCQRVPSTSESNVCVRMWGMWSTLHPSSIKDTPDGTENTAYPDGELLPQGCGPTTPATTWARHAAAAAAGAAARVAIGPPRAQALCKACALAARTLGQAAVWLLNLLRTVQLSEHDRRKQPGTRARGPASLWATVEVQD